MLNTDPPTGWGPPLPPKTPEPQPAIEEVPVEQPDEKKVDDAPAEA